MLEILSAVIFGDPCSIVVATEEDHVGRDGGLDGSGRENLGRHRIGLVLGYQYLSFSWRS